MFRFHFYKMNSLSVKHFFSTGLAKEQIAYVTTVPLATETITWQQYPCQQKPFLWLNHSQKLCIEPELATPHWIAISFGWLDCLLVREIGKKRRALLNRYWGVLYRTCKALDRSNAARILIARCGMSQVLLVSLCKVWDVLTCLFVACSCVFLRGCPILDASASVLLAWRCLATASLVLCILLKRQVSDQPLELKQ